LLKGHFLSLILLCLVHYVIICSVLLYKAYNSRGKALLLIVTENKITVSLNILVSHIGSY